MKSKFALLCVLAVLAAAITASAHHSFAATYDESKTIEILGKVVVFSFRNPHSLITVEVADGGKKYRWAVEGPGSGGTGRELAISFSDSRRAKPRQSPGCLPADRHR